MEPVEDPTYARLAPHAKQESDTSIVRERTDTEVTISRQVVVKEESSDDSTIISSQTSTLTRNQDCESFQTPIKMKFEDLVNCLRDTENYDDSEDSDDDDDDDEDEEDEEERMITVEFRPNEKLEVVLEDCGDQEEEEKYFDKQTNTECAFYPEHAKQMKLNAATNGGLSPLDDRGAIKRSQTFSPSAHVNKNHYICKLNRSDSDSAMPLYRRGGNPFQRNAVERRSLRIRRQSSSVIN